MDATSIIILAALPICVSFTMQKHLALAMGHYETMDYQQKSHTKTKNVLSEKVYYYPKVEIEAGRVDVMPPLPTPYIV